MKKILRFIIIFLIFMIISTSSIFAIENLKIDIKISNENIKVDDVIDVTIAWSQEMQATDYSINYDWDKLEFISANIPDNFYNNIESGKILVCWYGETSISNMIFKFKAINDGNANISVIPDAFANENLEMPADFIVEPITINIGPKITPTQTPSETVSPSPTVVPTQTPTAVPTQFPNETIKPSPTIVPNQTPSETISPAQTVRPTNTPINSDNVQIDKEDNTIATNKIPHAGIGISIMIFIIIVSILAVALKIKLKNLKDVK